MFGRRSTTPTASEPAANGKSAASVAGSPAPVQADELVDVPVEPWSPDKAAAPK